MRLLTVTNTAIVDRLAFSLDGTRLAAACQKSNVRVWDVISGKAPINLKGTRDREFVGFAGGPDALIVSTWNTPAVLWDLTSLAQRTIGPAPVYCRDVADGSALWEADCAGPRGLDTCVLYDAAGTGVFVINRRVTTLDAATGAELASFALTFRSQISTKDAAVSPDGRWLAVRGEEGLQVRDLADGRLAFEEPALSYPYALAFSPDGKRLAATPPYGGERGEHCIDFWEAGTWRRLPSFNPGIVSPKALAFSPNGMLVAAGGFNGKVALWDVD
jgi:WD40 repeat protein